MKSSKMVLMNLFAAQHWRYRHLREQTCVHSSGKERVGRIDRVALKHTLPHLRQIASGTLLYDSGSSAQYSDNLEGWDGMGDEREVQEGGDRCIPMAYSCRCMAETNIIE